MIGFAITCASAARAALLNLWRRSSRAELRMTITQEAFGARLKHVREFRKLTLVEVQRRLSEEFHLSLSSADLEAIEAGERKVTSYEFESLHFVYKAPIGYYFALGHPAEQLFAELRVATRKSKDPSKGFDALIGCLAVHYEMANLKKFCGERNASPFAYKLKTPQTKAQAKRQGQEAAINERRRLQLGSRPIADMYRLLDEEGIDVSLRPLPEDISGAMLAERERVNPFVVINDLETDGRKAFSLAHEYAHVLMDRSDVAAVAFRDKSDDLREVRANAFAVAFLMPDTGIRDILASRPGGRSPSLRKRPISAENVVQLAEIFGVSRTAMIYRLRELKHLASSKESDALKEQCRTLNVAEAPRGTLNPFVTRFIELAKKAVLTREISRGKFREVVGLIGVPRARAYELLEIDNP